MLELLVALLLIAVTILILLVISLGTRVRQLERTMAAPGGAARPPAFAATPAAPPLSDRMPGPAAADELPPEAAPPVPAAPAPASEPLSFESLVGGRLLIWIGGAALVIAAVFLIRFSIEIGLVTPAMRMIAAGLFGLALVAGGEWARVSPRLADDPRISQALVGAGIAILYATVYGSYILYGFFGGGTASALMLAITAVALGLSLRHGAPTAAMGLVGGFLTPLLVGDPDAGAVPLLLYLALLDAAIFAIAWKRGWGWMAAVAVLASLMWTFFLAFADGPDALAGGAFALALGIVATLPHLAGRATLFVPALGLVGAQLGLLVQRGEYGALPWLMFGAAAIASILVARLRHRPPAEPIILLAIGAFLLIVRAADEDFPLVWQAAAGLVAIFGGGGLAIAFQRRSSAWAAAASAGFSSPVLALLLAAESRLAATGWALLLALAAAGCAAAVAASRRGTDEGAGVLRPLLPALAMTVLLALSLYWLIAGDLLSLGWIVLAIAIIVAGVRIPERALRVTGLILLTVTILKVFLIDAAALDGLLRILSFLGLGASLIALGRYYSVLLKAERALK